MNSRRSLLSNVGTLIAAVPVGGCAGTPGEDENENSTVDTATGGVTSTTTSSNRSRMEDTTIPVEAYEFDWSGTVEETRRDGEPPVVRLKLRNVSGSKVNVGFGSVSPFVDPFGKSDAGDGLLLYNDEMGPELTTTETPDACPSLDTRDIAIYDILRTEQLAPGDSASARYSVYSWTENETCYPDGEYLFEDTSSLCTGQRECEGRVELELRATIVVESNQVRRVETSYQVE